MAKGHYTNTTAYSSMETGPGKVAGAGELGFAAGPGKAAMKTKVSCDMGVDSSSGKNSYKPNGLKTTAKCE